MKNIAIATSLCVAVLFTASSAALGADVAPEVSSESEVGAHGEGEGHGEHADGPGGHGAEVGHDGHDAHASHGNTNPLSVDPDLAIFTAIIFILLSVVLGKFAWGPIRDAVEEREKRIADELAEAHRSNEEARQLLAEHESKLASASEEIKGMLEGARKDADAQKSAILAEAEAAAKAQKERAVREIDAAKNSALEELATSSVDQAVGLAGQIMGKQLDKGDHTQLIAEAMKQFPSNN